MPQPKYSTDEIVELGEAIYEQKLRSQVEAAHKGEFLVLDITTGEYEVDPSNLVAVKRLKNRLPNAVAYGLRIGHRAAFRIGRFSKARHICRTGLSRATEQL